MWGLDAGHLAWAQFAFTVGLSHHLSRRRGRRHHAGGIARSDGFEVFTHPERVACVTVGRKPHVRLTFCLALGGLAVSGTPSFAQRSPYSYHLCALDKAGATDCYYDSARACAVQTLAPCIPNPWYDGSDAMAQAPLQHRHRVAH